MLNIIDDGGQIVVLNPKRSVKPSPAFRQAVEIIACPEAYNASLGS